MSPSVFVERKAERLLASDGVVIVCGEDGPQALVRGDHAVYALRASRAGWRCSCPSWQATCSHAEAVRRVTAAHGWVLAYRDALIEPSQVWGALRREADERLQRYARGERV